VALIFLYYSCYLCVGIQLPVVIKTINADKRIVLNPKRFS
jgi:hypothetical protein